MQTKIAANSGIHVCTEKPMALNLSDAKEMIKICKDSNVKLFVIKQNRLNPTLQILKKKVEENKFPLVRLIKKLPKKPSLFETVLITINDYLVYKFLEKKINFQRLIKLIHKISNLKEFQKFKKIKPKSVDQINNLRNYVHLKIESLGI